MTGGMEIPDSPEGLPDRPARRDCGFCGWERTPKDDNHAPTCSYWHFFGDPDKPCPCWKCNDLPDPRPVPKT